MKSKITGILFLFVACSILTLHANDASNGVLQNANVSGTVSDAGGEPLIGVNVSLKGTTTGTITDMDGMYTLSVPNRNGTLVFSYVGYASQEIAINNRQNINVTLMEDAQLIDEVVVVGYGSQKKINLTGAVATVDSKTLLSRPVQNVSGALQGLMPGVNVQSGQGRPGQDGATIRVRGVGTLNTSNATPYVLIDGVETGTMNSLDPNDIESISVLKDAGSAAIYGSKASNGVILITTKRGQKSDKPLVTYSGYAAIQQPTNMIERMSSYDYARLWKKAVEDEKGTSRFSNDDLQKFKDGSSPYTHPNTDWYDLAFKAGLQHQHNVSVSGGTDKMTYMGSVGYLGQEGILPNSNRKQFNGRLNLSTQITDRLNVRMNMAYIKNDYKDPTNSYVRGGSDQIIRQLNILAPWIPNRYEDGTYGTSGDGNPIAWLDLDQTEDRFNQNFSGLLAFDYEIIDGLKATLQGAYTSNMQHYRQFMKDIQYNPNKYHGPAYLNENYYLWNRTTFDATLNYEKTFGKHNLKALAGWHTEKYNYNENTMSRNTFPNNELTDMNAGAASTQTNGGVSRVLAMVSGFGRINYDYAGKYLLEANVRADASSRFSPENRWGYFPSFSAGWRISEEQFMEGTKGWLSNLKIRGSYGLLGDQNARDKDNNLDYYPWISTYDLGGSYPLGGRLETGYYQAAFKIEDFSWEKSRTYGVGIDASIMNDINISIDYYDRLTTDIIMQVNAPAEFGLGGYMANVGQVSNKGVEVSLGYNKQLGEFNLSAMANVSYNKNKILDIGKNAKGESEKQIINGNTIRRLGGQIDAFYTYPTDGLFRSQQEVDEFTAKYNRANGTTMFSHTFQPGDVRYVDVNGPDNDGDGFPDAGPDGKIDANDRILYNSTTPAWTAGLSLNLTWKQWDLSALFSGAFGASRIFSAETFGYFNGDTGHPSNWWLDAWTKDNPNSNVPRIYNDRNSNSDARNHMSSFWVFSTDFVRMKNLQLGYSIPAAALKKINISRLRVFCSMENLFSIDSMPLGLDPETSSERASSYPLIRTHSLGVSLTF
ncbi:MAG: TonB-dependent receptor [Tannerellaceae bacterium]|nr:TonB-dependent receptor [Tannerellaceae bacterium]